MAADEGKVKIEKFDGVDFGFGKCRLKTICTKKKQYQPLLGKKPDNIMEDD